MDNFVKKLLSLSYVRKVSSVGLILFLLLFNTYTIFAAGPAGVEDDLAIWLSADSGAKVSGGAEATNGETVTSWEDQSEANRDASGNGAVYQTTGLNFNPTLYFTDDNYTASDTGLAAGSSGRSIFVVASANASGWRYVFGQGSVGTSLGAFDFGHRSTSEEEVFITSHNAQEAYQASWSWLPHGAARLAYGDVQDGEMYLAVNGAVPVRQRNAASTLNTILDGALNIGCRSAGNECWNGNISEIIFYNRVVTSTERQRINSYLALKYGFSLDQSTAQSYLASGTAVMWDSGATGATTYDNGLFGIGRDDSSNLAQLKSRGQTSTNIIILEAVGEGSNGNPSFSDIQDLEFLVIGDNGGDAEWTTTGAPTGYSILEKTWAKQERGDVGPVNLDFDVADSDFNVPAALDNDKYYFIYDSDSDGSLADETPQAMTDQGSNIWRTTVDFGTGGLFTLASTENPAITNLSPADNATNVGATSNLSITFSKNISAGTGNIVIKRTADDSTFETIDVNSGQVTGIGSSVVTVNPTNNFVEGVGYYIQIASTAFKDSLDRFFAGISTTTGWNFTIADSTNPVLSSIGATTVTNTGATITWSTNENASTKVVYGLTTSYGNAPAETDTSPRVTSHSVSLSSLLPCTTYHYKVTSTDGASNSTTSEDKTFTTTGCPADETPTNTTTNSVTVSTGGTTSLTENGTQLTVETPENFTSGSTSVIIQIKAINASPVLSELGKPTALPNEVGSLVFDVKAIINGSTVLDSFDAPITITYQYPESVTNSMIESTFWLYHYHDDEWEALENCTVTLSTNTISCTTDSFSIFGLFGDMKSNSGSSNSSNSSSTPLGYCGNIKPDTIPDLFQIDVSRNKSVLYFTPLMNNVSNYYISYGYSSGEERFGVFTDLGSSTGVLSYTINHLDKNMDYYFKVRPHNGCAVGDWSNVMKVTTTKNVWDSISYFKSYVARMKALFPRSVTELDIGTTQVSGITTKSKSKSTGTSCSYTVQAGDTLWSIAGSELGDTYKYKEIMQENNLTDSVVNSGQKLKIGC